MGLNVLGYQSDRLQRCHLAFGREGFSCLSPVLASRFFIAMQVRHSYNSSTNGVNFTYSRSHAFRYERQNKYSGFHNKIKLTTSALVSVRGYQLDHSGDEDWYSVLVLFCCS